MSKKLRNVRRAMSGYTETPAPEEKRKSLKSLKERPAGGAHRFMFDLENSSGIFLEALRGMRPNGLTFAADEELTFYGEDPAQAGAEQQADDAILYGTRRVEATYRGLQHTPDGVRQGSRFFDGGVVTGRSVGRTATQMMEASMLRASELPAVLSAPEVEIDLGSISRRQAAQMLGYSQRDSAQGILAAYRQAYGGNCPVEVSCSARPEGFTHNRRDGFHVNDVSFVTVMREAARREGWDLARPRNMVPTGLSGRDLVEFRHILAGVEAEFVGKDCLFFGFGPTRTLVLIAGPEPRAALGSTETWCLVLCPIPFRSTQVEMHMHDFTAMTARPTPLRQARRRAFELFDTIRSGASGW